MPPMADHLPPYCVHISHRVEHPDRWKAGFDGLERARRDAGILGHHINRALDDPYLITVFLPLTDLDQATSFTSAYVRDEALHVLGIESHPRIQWLQPIREAVVWHRQVPAFLLSARVVDFDVWLVGYDTLASLHHGAGIIGHAVKRSLEDSSSVTVYHQAESFDALHNFLADPKTRSGMLGDGVGCELRATFHTGGWAKTY
jgi:hypothetical protein